MFVDNEMGNKESNASNRYTKIGNILQDYIDEENEESKKNNSRTSSVIKKNKANKKITKYKIILLGEPGVGKTTIINKYIFNKFESSPIYQNENDTEKNIKMIDIDEHKSVELSIYDTTKEKNMSKITRNYYKDAHGAIIVFDVGNKESFNKVKYWLKETNNYAPKDIVFCILGNKTDVPSANQINISEVKNLYGDKLCYDVSAKDGNNISLAFEQLTFKIITEEKKRKKAEDVVLRGSDGRKSINLNDININNSNNSKKSKCC